MLEYFEVPDYYGPGVYMIANITKSKIYIGCTNNINQRANMHKSKLKKGKHDNTELNNDRNDDLIFLIIKKIEKKECESSTEHRKRLLLSEKLFLMQIMNFKIDIYNSYNHKPITYEYLSNAVLKTVFRDEKCIDTLSRAYGRYTGYNLQFMKRANDERKQMMLDKVRKRIEE